MKLGRVFWVRTDKVNARGTCPVSLRLTLPGHKHADVSTGVTCTPANWDAKGKKSYFKPAHPDCEDDTETLLEIRRNAKIAKQRLEAVGQPVTPQAVAALLKNPKALQPGPPPCLLAFMEEELKLHYQPGNRATYESQRTIVGKLRGYHGPGRLPLTDFPPRKVQAFYRHLLASTSGRGGEIATANKTVSHLQGMFRRGIRHGLWSEAQNPFLCLDKQAAPRRKKPRLTPDELRTLLAYPLERTDWLWRARASLVLQFYLRGERIGACLLLRWADIKGEAISYQAQKGGPHKRVPIRPELAQLFKCLTTHYPGRPYVLPYLPAGYARLSAADQLTEIKKVTALINKGLKKLAGLAGIEKAISTHAARRTFGTIGRKVAGVAAVQAMFGHTTENMTQTYLDNTDTDEMDSAADRIFDSLL